MAKKKLNLPKYKKPMIHKKKIRVKLLTANRRFFDSINHFIDDSSVYLVQYCGFACFPADVKICLANGTTKMIQNIIPGDSIPSYNFKKGVLIKNKVVEKIVHPNFEGGYLIINDKLKVTNNHPVFVNKSVWKRADKLTIGDTLLGMQGKEIVIKKIEKINKNPITVYNLHLQKKEHNFFAEGVLVHNGEHDHK